MRSLCKTRYGGKTMRADVLIKKVSGQELLFITYEIRNGCQSMLFIAAEVDQRRNWEQLRSFFGGEYNGIKSSSFPLGSQKPVSKFLYSRDSSVNNLQKWKWPKEEQRTETVTASGYWTIELMGDNGCGRLLLPVINSSVAQFPHL